MGPATTGTPGTVRCRIRMSTTTGSERPGLSVLGLDAELAATCVSCGLCLPHCPTFRVTGEEKYSPRGRIDAMRAVESGVLPIDDEFVDFVETCVQCRGCETGLPERRAVRGVDGADATALADRRADDPWWQRVGFRILPRHRVLLAGSTALAVGQRLRLVPKRLGIPPLPLRRSQRSRRPATTSGCSPGASWTPGSARRTATRRR
jgi:glycolate oxidase iron-sulfur subunit